MFFSLCVCCVCVCVCCVCMCVQVRIQICIFVKNFSMRRRWNHLLYILVASDIEKKGQN